MACVKFDKGTLMGRARSALRVRYSSVEVSELGARHGRHLQCISKHSCSDLRALRSSAKVKASKIVERHRTFTLSVSLRSNATPAHWSSAHWYEVTPRSLDELHLFHDPKCFLEETPSHEAAGVRRAADPVAK